MTLEYDGAAYEGWQIQGTKKTIQGTLEEALKKITGEDIRISGSGRTDAGVHAENQTASFVMVKQLGERTLLAAMNALLPHDIVVKKLEEAPLTFHARFQAKSKVYCYRIVNSSLRPVIGRQYCWHYRPLLDLDCMRVALSCLVGTHDFSAFCGSGSATKNQIRTLMSGCIERQDFGLIIITLEADGFLKHMVRNIVGTLVEVGRGRTKVAEVPYILASRNRSQAGPTAPACGLFLKQVKYEADSKDSVSRGRPYAEYPHLGHCEGALGDRGNL